MKEKYQNPEMEIIEMDVEDVVRTSGGCQCVGQEASIVLPDDNW